jgi:hypothetical protein
VPDQDRKNLGRKLRRARDTKFSLASDEIFHTEGMKVIRTGCARRGSASTSPQSRRRQPTLFT